jgi:hypothetical protein
MENPPGPVDFIPEKSHDVTDPTSKQGPFIPIKSVKRKCKKEKVP